MTVPSMAALTYRPDIDGLRAVAVLMVVGFHAFPEAVPGGFVGVDIFLVISGFLITSIILHGRDDGSFSYAGFYRRRMVRILPALLVMLAAVLCAGWFRLGALDYATLGRHVLAGAGFFSNFLLWREVNYFDSSAELKPLLHLWSLAIEEQFYLLWPLFIGALYGNPKRVRRLVWVLAGVAILSFVIGLASFPDHRAAAFYSPLSRFWELALGGLLAWGVRYHPLRFGKHLDAQATAGLVLLGASLWWIDRTREFPGWWALLPTIGAMLLISAGGNAWVNRIVLAQPVAVWIGRVSYPLYLWHWPMLALASIDQGGQPLALHTRVGLVGLSFVLAWLTYRGFELPVRERRARAIAPLLAVTACVVAGAAAVAFSVGFPDRAANTNAARAFVERYRHLHLTGLSAYYEEQCNYYDWTTNGYKPIDASCTAVAPGRPVYLLWGDSHAQALAFGFRQSLAAPVQAALVAASGCKPALRHEANNGQSKVACKASIDTALQFIRQHRPERVFIAQAEGHDATDAGALARFVRDNGGELVLVGPVPQWRPSLPLVVSKHLALQPTYVGEGLDSRILAMDERLRATYAQGPVRYLSIVEKLCRRGECIAQVAPRDGFSLLVLDYGHLTPAGSAFVGKVVFDPFLNPTR